MGDTCDNMRRLSDKKIADSDDIALSSSQDPEYKQDKISELRENLISSFKEIIIAAIILGIILGSLAAYTWHWPPVVIVESKSMMHGDDSTVGTMDTGDIVLVKSISGRQEINTYLEGEKSNLKTYGSYGEIIAFKKNGGSGTPVIHRAIFWLKYNESGFNTDSDLANFGTFDIPSLGLYNITKIEIDDYGPNHDNLTINLNDILFNFKENYREPHGGFITKGDNNAQIDQLSPLRDSDDLPIEPVEMKWVIGKAVGELPWLGLIKLYISGETSDPDSTPPITSVNMLIVSIALIIITVVILHLSFWHIERIRRKRREREEDRKLLPFQYRIINRLNPKKSKPRPQRPKTSKKRPVLAKQEFRVSKEGKMLRYLDKMLIEDEEDYKPPLKIIKKVKSISYAPKPSNGAQVTQQRDDTPAPLAKPINQKSSPSPYLTLPEPPVTRHSATLAKPVSEDTKLRILDTFLENREDD